MEKKCELKWCASDYGDKRFIWVNENIDDASFNTRICKTCATALGLSKAQDLPDANIVEKTLKRAKRERKLQKA